MTDGVVGDNEIVNLFVTKPSSFKLGIGVKENIKNEGTLTQIGVSTFNDNIDMVDYVQNANTSNQKTVIPILNICTNQTGNKIVLYNRNSPLSFCGISITRNLPSISYAFMNYHCNSIGLTSGHRFYVESVKILDINTLSMLHIGKTTVLCADQDLRSGFQFENNRLNEISLLFKSDISDSVSDSSIVVSNTNNFFTPNSGKMVIKSGEIEINSNRFSQYFNNTFTTLC